MHLFGQCYLYLSGRLLRTLLLKVTAWKEASAFRWEGIQSSAKEENKQNKIKHNH